MSETAEKKKMNLLPFHVIVTLLLMFGFGHLPCFGPVTPLGMQLLGIFLGLVYAWTATSLLWPSLLGIAAISLWGIMPMTEFAKVSFGNSTVVFIFFIFIWSYVKKKYKLNVTNFHILRASFNSPFSTHLLPFF